MVGHHPKNSISMGQIGVFNEAVEPLFIPMV
jgi:hypothetical protein